MLKRIPMSASLGQRDEAGSGACSEVIPSMPQPPLRVSQPGLSALPALLSCNLPAPLKARFLGVHPIIFLEAAQKSSGLFSEM